MNQIVRTGWIKLIVYPICISLIFNLGLFSGTQEFLGHLQKQFKAARRMYFARRYDLTKRILETLKRELTEIKNEEYLKGKTCLLLGATYEKLNKVMDALKNYRLAKKFFKMSQKLDNTENADGNIVEGLDVNTLQWYSYEGKIPPVGVITQPGSRKNTKKTIFMALGVTVFCALIWYLFIRDTRNKPEEIQSDEQSRLMARYLFSTEWKIDLKSEGVDGAATFYHLQPVVDWEPDPGPNNEWDDTALVVIVADGKLLWGTAALSVTMEGCNNGTRHDKIWVNDKLVYDKQLKFENNCDLEGLKAGKKLLISIPTKILERLKSDTG